MFIGKNDVTETVVQELNNLLTARELVKVKVQETSTVEPKAVANELAEMLNAEFVQAIDANSFCTGLHQKKKTGRSYFRDKGELE